LVNSLDQRHLVSMVIAEQCIQHSFLSRITCFIALMRCVCTIQFNHAVPGTTNLAPLSTAWCCHLANLMALPVYSEFHHDRNCMQAAGCGPAESSSLYRMWQPTHQRPVYQLHIIRREHFYSPRMVEEIKEEKEKNRNIKQTNSDMT